MHDLPGSDCRALKALIDSRYWSLPIRGAGELYTPGCLAELATRSPFRVSSLNGRRKEMARRRGLVARLIEALLAGGEEGTAFPRSLMPRF